MKKAKKVHVIRVWLCPHEFELVVCDTEKQLAGIKKDLKREKILFHVYGE